MTQHTRLTRNIYKDWARQCINKSLPVFVSVLLEIHRHLQDQRIFCRIETQGRTCRFWRPLDDDLDSMICHNGCLRKRDAFLQLKIRKRSNKHHEGENNRRSLIPSLFSYNSLSSLAITRATITQANNARNNQDVCKAIFVVIGGFPMKKSEIEKCL